jgi:hypothetical protein
VSVALARFNQALRKKAAQEQGRRGIQMEPGLFGTDPPEPVIDSGQR